MTGIVLCNGLEADDPGRVIAADDRGLNYGDGLFETTLLRDGSVRFLEAHLRRLEAGCQRLAIPFACADLEKDIAHLSAVARNGVLKIVVTRGSGGRGYRADPASTPRRIVTVHPLPPADASEGLIVRWCDLRLSRNPALAGMKHLNRLEQVLAQNEWNDAGIAEGLMLDTEDELVSGTASNVFIVRNGALLTPDLRFCGVRGVMRGQVMCVAHELGLSCSEEPLWPHDLDDATEAFLTNAVRGIRSLAAIGERRWDSRVVADQLTKALHL